jgi:hypothetical protein
MRAHLPTAPLALALSLAGCSFPVNDKVTPPPALGASEGLQFVMPDTVIRAGEERMTCWVPDYTPDQDHEIVSFEPLQGAYGHHLVAMMSGVPRAAGTVFDCTDIEQMASLRPLILPDRGDGQVLLPPGFAVKLPQGARIVFQSHHINTSDRDLLEADVARLHFAPAGSHPTMAGYFIMNSSQQNLAAHTTGTVGVTCSPPVALQAVALFGHMHHLGTSLSLTRAREGSTERIYSVDPWRPEHRDFPPVNLYPPSEPFVFDPADTYSLTCNYDNQTGDTVKFPTEMCTAVSYYFPALPDPLVLCD